MKRLALAVTLVLASFSAQAAPWRFETGLPNSPDKAGQYAPDPPVSTDGVEHPSLVWRGIELGAIADAFITYRLHARQGQLFHEFELSRMQITGFASYRNLVGANITFETIRSSGNRSYFGVDGDSQVTRVKWAFAEITPFKHWLSLRGGFVPDVLLQYVEGSWAFRVQGPVGLERDGLFMPSDLGVTLEGNLPMALGSIAVAFGNGEGVNLREQNNGKNITAALRLRPGHRRLPGLLLHVLYRDGSLGAGSAADHRLSGGLTYTGTKLGAGAIGTWALGYRGVGARDAGHLTLWARGELPKHVQLFTRFDLLWPDTTFADAMQLRYIGGIAYRLPMLARILVSYEGTFPFGALTAQVPSIQEHNLLVQIEARL